MEAQKKLMKTLSMLIVFLIFVGLIKFVDVGPIGPNGSSVGFSHMNQTMHELTGVNLVWYEITEKLGYLIILGGLCYALLGAYQLVSRKSVFKVDQAIVELGFLYVEMVAVYVLFEKIVINYRPIIMPGETELELSFPSSHTVLSCTILGGILVILKDYVKNDLAYKLVQAFCVAGMVIMVFGRLYSGVHWFTDIIGGLMITDVLVMHFWYRIELARKAGTLIQR